VRRPKNNPNKPTSTVMSFRSSVINAYEQYITFDYPQRIIITR